MLSHFEKLKTPLKSVFAYPDIQSQQARFINRGWSQVDVSSLWQIWSSDEWLSADKRKWLDTIEPFDEWEEFALFASHYCVVMAKVYPGSITTVYSMCSYKTKHKINLWLNTSTPNPY